MQDSSHCGVLVWLAPRDGALFVLHEGYMSVRITLRMRGAYIVGINVCKMIEEPVDLLRAGCRVELIECDDVSVRGLLDGAPERAYTLIWLCAMSVGAYRQEV